MAVYGYMRVSTQKQVEQGESLDVQRRIISGYCLMQGFPDPVFVCEEGVSGSRPFLGRPAGGAMFAKLQPGDIIVAAKLDRMFRSSLDALSVLEKASKMGVQIHLIDLGGDINTDMVGRLVFTILAAVAEAERTRIQERIRDVKSDQKRRGRYLGGPVTYGYRIGSSGELEEHPEEQRAIRRMRELRAKGWSFRKIDEEIRRMGIRSSYATVRRICCDREDAIG